MRPLHGNQKNFEPNDHDISRFSELNLLENDSQKENANIFREAQMSEKKSAKSMILKAFSSQKACVSHPDKDNSALSVNRPLAGVRKSPMKKTLTEVQEHPMKKTLTEVQEQSTSSSTAMEAVESYFMQHGGYSGRDKTSNRTLSSLCTKSDYSGLPDPLTFGVCWPNISQFIHKLLKKFRLIHASVCLQNGLSIFGKFPYTDAHEGDLTQVCFPFTVFEHVYAEILLTELLPMYLSGPLFVSVYYGKPS
ncbi:hypothetical protein AHF37_10148 [Paragonimus kellicotti]|nr:hypothetical protein AHF37_10148 [Paragonimus kellicotti]